MKVLLSGISKGYDTLRALGFPLGGLELLEAGVVRFRV